MKIQNLINNHQVSLRHSFGYKLEYDKTSITLSDQEEACTNAEMSYEFARLKIPGADIKKCQKFACKDPGLAYWFAKCIPGADIRYCQEHACKDVMFATWFAGDIPGADIEYSIMACANIITSRKKCKY